MVLEELQGSEYRTTKELIERKFAELHDRILSKSQEGYWKKNTKQLKEVLPFATGSVCSRKSPISTSKRFSVRPSHSLPSLQVALASLLVTENAFAKESPDYMQQTSNQSASAGVTKLIAFVGKYLRRIRKNYSTVTHKRIIERMGMQFCELLVQ